MRTLFGGAGPFGLIPLGLLSASPLGAAHKTGVPQPLALLAVHMPKPLLEDFRSYLTERGYRPVFVHRYATGAAQFLVWLGEHPPEERCVVAATVRRFLGAASVESVNSRAQQLGGAQRYRRAGARATHPRRVGGR